MIAVENRSLLFPWLTNDISLYHEQLSYSTQNNYGGVKTKERKSQEMAIILRKYRRIIEIAEMSLLPIMIINFK